MKGKLNTALIATLVFSQVPAFGMQAAASGLAKNVWTGAKQVAERVMTNPQVIHAAQIAKQNAVKGAELTSQAGQKVVAQAGVLFEKQPKAFVGTTVALAGTGIAGVSNRGASNKLVSDATQQAAQGVVDHTAKATVSLRDTVVNGAHDAVRASWIQAQNAGRFVATKAQNAKTWIAATPAAQSVQKAGNWVASTRVAQSIKAHPDRWFAGAFLSAYVGCIGYLVYKSYKRNHRNICACCGHDSAHCDCCHDCESCPDCR